LVMEIDCADTPNVIRNEAPSINRFFLIVVDFQLYRSNLKQLYDYPTNI
jgi:hypothetical protein